MTEKTFNKKMKELQDQYIYWAELRKKAMHELDKIIKKTHKLEDKYFSEHPKELED